MNTKKRNHGDISRKATKAPYGFVAKVGIFGLVAAMQFCTGAQADPLYANSDLSPQPQVGTAFPPSLWTWNGISPSDVARIDALNPRFIVYTPSVKDTVFGDMFGFKETLADYGFGFTGILTGQFADQISGLPRYTNGKQAYIGQQSELDTSASIAVLTYDLGRLGLKGGLVTIEGCGADSTNPSNYPIGVRLCGAYVDQLLLDGRLEINAGIINESYQYANPLVGGSVATGSIGPSANILTEMGLAAGGEGAPAANISYKWTDDLYSKLGVQRSTSPKGYVYDGRYANPDGVTFSEPGAGPLYLGEFGYRHQAAPGSNYTWFRIGGGVNDSDFTDFLHKDRTQGVQAIYALYDQQLLQVDPDQPRRGLYVGTSYMGATSAVVTYDHYYEARLYSIGAFDARPKDQMSFVSTLTQASNDYLLSNAGKLLHQNVYNYNFIYGFNLAPGLFLNADLTYSVHPSVIYENNEGSPWVAKLSISAYF